MVSGDRNHLEVIVKLTVVGKPDAKALARMLYPQWLAKRQLAATGVRAHGQTRAVSMPEDLQPPHSGTDALRDNAASAPLATGDD